jgi:hypothetical protein
VKPKGKRVRERYKREQMYLRTFGRIQLNKSTVPERKIFRSFVRDQIEVGPCQPALFLRFPGNNSPEVKIEINGRQWNNKKPAGEHSKADVLPRRVACFFSRSVGIRHMRTACFVGQMRASLTA